jgi:hypothetical protein
MARILWQERLARGSFRANVPADFRSFPEPGRKETAGKLKEKGVAFAVSSPSFEPSTGIFREKY